MADDAFVLEAYLQRVGLRGRPSLTELHRAHVVAIPFENLDPQRGVPARLEAGALQRKLVQERRGGYCFEHNLLLAHALRALGADVQPLLARVRLGRGDGDPRPRTHLTLRVRADGGDWLADVGFGSGTLLAPIPFGPGDVHEQSGWRVRIVTDGAEHVLQSAAGADWVDLYGFVPEPVPDVDIETSNWYTSTFPRSPFVTGLLVAAPRPDGTRLTLSDWGELRFARDTPAGSELTPVQRSDVPELLATHFGLPGWALGAGGRIVPADEA